MSYSPQVQAKQPSLWDTLTKHATNLYNEGKKRVGQATERVKVATNNATQSVASAAAPAPARPTTMTTTTTMSPSTPSQQYMRASQAMQGGKKRRYHTKKHGKGKGKGKKRGATKRHGKSKSSRSHKMNRHSKRK